MEEHKSFFELNDLKYPDSSLGLELSLTVKCWLVHNAEPSADEEIKTILSEIIVALGFLDVPYTELTHNTATMYNAICRRFSQSERLSSASAVRFGITELYPSQSDYPRIINARNNKPAQTRPPHGAQTAPSSNAGMNTWVCPQCSSQQSGQFCNRCGTRKPSSGNAVQPSQAASNGLYDVILYSYKPEEKMNVIAIVRSVCRLGLADAKNLVESAPSVLKTNVEPVYAEMLQENFAKSGANVRLQRSKQD